MYVLHVQNAITQYIANFSYIGAVSGGRAATRSVGGQEMFVKRGVGLGGRVVGREGDGCVVACVKVRI